MTFRKILVLSVFLLMCSPCFGQEVIISFEEESLPVLNEELRKLFEQIQQSPSESVDDVTIERNASDEISLKLATVAKGGTGQDFSSKPAGGIIYLSGTGVMAVLPKASDDDQLKLASGIPAWFTPASSGVNKELFTADGTFTVPSGITKIYLTMVGGGGGGGGTANAGQAGGGGGGAWIVHYVVSTTPLDDLLVQVGDGGPGGSAGANDGTIGQSTIFDTGGDAITCVGGGPGSKASTGAGGTGAGGLDSGGVNAGGGFTNKSGDGSVGDGNGGYGGGGGGGTPFGVGANGATDNVPGSVGAAGANTGAGGGGTSRYAGGSFAGGNGGSGFALVEW